MVEWVDIPGYESTYKISNSGEVKLKARDICDKDGHVIRSIEEKIVEPFKDRETGEMKVILYNGSKYDKFTITELLQFSFN